MIIEKPRDPDQEAENEPDPCMMPTLSQLQTSPRQFNHPPRYLTPNTTQQQYYYHYRNCLSGNSLHAIACAKNTIAFFRFLNEGLFQNSDPGSFVVIEDEKLLGVYEDEKNARHVAEKRVAGELAENQYVDGMVFPVSGKFKKRNAGHFNGYAFDPYDPIRYFE